MVQAVTTMLLCLFVLLRVRFARCAAYTVALATSGGLRS